MSGPKRIVRRPWGSFVLFALVLAASAGGLLILGAQAARGTTFERYSTYRAEPDGASALYETLQDLGFHPTRETEDLRSLPDDGSLLVLVGPFARPDPAATAAGGKPNPLAALSSPMPEGEVQRVLEWVRRGGRLLVLEGHDNPLYRALKVDVRGNPEPLENLALEAVPATYTAYTASGARLSLGNRASLAPLEGDWTPLWKDKDGDPVALADDAFGKGEIVLLADPSVATNAGLVRAQNYEALRAIIEGSPGDVRTVRFDELRHGFASTRNVMGYVRRQNLHLPVVQGAITFVLLVWAAARARRRPRGAAALERIESREFVSAMANIYSRARLGEHAARSFLRRCERALAIALGERPGKLTDEDVAARLREQGVRNFRGWEAVRDEAITLGLDSEIRVATAPDTAESGATAHTEQPEKREPREKAEPAAALAGRAIPDRRLLSFARLAGNLEREVRAAARISVDELL